MGNTEPKQPNTLIGHSYHFPQKTAKFRVWSREWLAWLKKKRVKSLSRVWLCDPMNCQASLSMEFSRHEYWSGLPFPSPGDLSDPGVKSKSPALQADSLQSQWPGKHQGILTFPFMQSCGTGADDFLPCIVDLCTNGNNQDYHLYLLTVCWAQH